jgi:hypothetical protein
MITAQKNRQSNRWIWLGVAVSVIMLSGCDLQDVFRYEVRTDRNIVDKPVVTKKPVVKPTTKKPVTKEEPATPPEPAVTKKPAVQERPEPVVTQKPTEEEPALQEPTTPKKEPRPAPQAPNTTNHTPHIPTAKALDHQGGGKNLIVNGSFELGLGTEPIYVGWRQKEYSADMTSPALPVIDETTASDESRSLRVDKLSANHILTLDFTPPYIAQSGTHRIHLGISAKSDCPNLRLHFPLTDKYLTTDWKHYTSYVDTAHPQYPLVQLMVYNETGKTCRVWFDEITWTLDTSGDDGWVRHDPIEAVFLGVDPFAKKRTDSWTRRGVYFDGKPVRLDWRAQADIDYAKVGIELHLRDLTRDGAVRIPWQTLRQLEGDRIAEGRIDLGRLKRGAYMAHLVFYRPDDHKILGTARTRFTVMADLTDTPAPVDFLVGMHGGFHAFTHSREFSWRGAWTADEYYQNAYQIGLRAQRIFADAAELTPQKNVYDLSILEPSIDHAAANGCTTVLSVDPFRLTTKNQAIPRGNDGDWIYTDGVDVSARANSTIYNVYRLPDDHMAGLFSRIAQRFGDKLIALENTNELNMYYHPDNMKYAVEDLFQPMYAAFKKHAPNVPVMVDFTMDFYGINYTDKFFQNGGINCADGFTYHPYGREWIYYAENGDHFGVKFIRRNETFRGNNSTTKKALVMGMTEVHSVGVYSAVGWDIMQRTLLDWSGGAKFSSGLLSGGMYFLETRNAGEWNNKSTTAPGVASVALNAMYDILGGFELVERVELDDGVLIVLFENKMTGAYAVAVAQGDYHTKRAQLAVTLPDDVRMYDQWGEKIAIPSAIKLDNEIRYFVSQDAGLLDTFRNGSITWVNETYGHDYQSVKSLWSFSPGPNDAWYAQLLKTGIRPYR